MPTILLIRHGQASFGAADYDQLSELGEKQAEIVAADLIARGLNVERILSGSLSRQRDSAAPLAAELGLPPVVDARWNEYDMDDILGVHSATAARVRSPQAGAGSPVSSRDFQTRLDGALTHWIDAASDSQTSETWPDFSGRVHAALEELAGAQAPGSTAVVFTSGGVLAAVCVRLLGLPTSALLGFNRVAINASVTKVVHGGRGLTLVSFNDHSHLERAGRSLLTYR